MDFTDVERTCVREKYTEISRKHSDYRNIQVEIDIQIFVKTFDSKSHISQATVATQGYHIYKNATWDQAKVGDKVLVEIESDKKSKEIDPYYCFIRTSVNQQIETVGHIPREISSHIYFFLKDEHGHIDGTVKSIDYRPSLIPAGRLEIPLTLNFKCPRYITHTKMKEFMSTLYSFDYNGNKEDERDESSSNEEINLFINEFLEESQSDSQVVIQTVKKRKAPLISESSEESQREVVNLKRKKKQPLINETSKLESDNEVVHPKRKTKPLLINEKEEDDNGTFFEFFP